MADSKPRSTQAQTIVGSSSGRCEILVSKRWLSGEAVLFELLFSLVCWKKVRGSASRFGPRRVPCFKGNWSIIPIWTKSMHFLLNIAELLDPLSTGLDTKAAVNDWNCTSIGERPRAQQGQRRW